MIERSGMGDRETNLESAEGINKFYKYMTSEVAKKVLETCSLRWSRPDNFNDPFEFQFSYYPDLTDQEIIEAFAPTYRKTLRGRLPGHQDSPFGKILNDFYFVDLTEDRIELLIAERLSKLPSIIEKLRARSNDTSAISRQLTDAKVLCLSGSPLEPLMWSHYAIGHTGVVLEFCDRSWADSFFGVAQPVQYSREFPSCYTASEFIEMLCGTHILDVKKIMNKLIYTKSHDWAYEKEYRIIRHMENPDKQTEDFGFHPCELSGIWLGLRTADVDIKAIVSLASRFPGVRILKMSLPPGRYAMDGRAETLPKLI